MKCFRVSDENILGKCKPLEYLSIHPVFREALVNSSKFNPERARRKQKQRHNVCDFLH